MYSVDFMQKKNKTQRNICNINRRGIYLYLICRNKIKTYF